LTHTMSAKSKLYELIQLSQNSKYPVGLSRPDFDFTDEFDQKTNTHYMTCRAVIEIDDKKTKFESDVYTNKKDANQDVCEKIHLHITNLECNREDVSISSRGERSRMSLASGDDPEEIFIDKYILILIDYENVSVDKEIDRLMQFLDRVSHIDLNNLYEDRHANCSESSEPPTEVIKFAGHASSMKNNADIVVKSTRRDAVDHYIGFYLGRRLGETPTIADTHSVHVLSRDRFASCLSDFCENVTHNVDVDDLIDSIRQMSDSIS
jgi:hypothetical protein